jgi:hypothetical protein
MNAASVTLNRACEACNQPFGARRSTARFCSTRCRVAAHRRRSAERELERARRLVDRADRAVRYVRDGWMHPADALAIVVASDDELEARLETLAEREAVAA